MQGFVIWGSCSTLHYKFDIPKDWTIHGSLASVDDKETTLFSITYPRKGNIYQPFISLVRKCYLTEDEVIAYINKYNRKQKLKKIYKLYGR